MVQNRRRPSGPALAIGIALALGIGSLDAAQSPAEFQALKKELEVIRQRQDALQKEVEALKGQAPLPTPSPSLTEVVLRLDKSPIRGSENARVILIEVSDYQCPFCGRYFQQTAPLIQREYVETGRIRHAFLNMPGAAHQNAFKAAEASVCAMDQGKFWEMHDRLFASQAALGVEQLPGYAELIGLNRNTFKTCLDTGRHAGDINSDLAMVRGAGVTATPTFFIGTIDPRSRSVSITQKIVGAKPFQTFKNALDALLLSTKTAG